ncbi:hypothetical protein [Streptomyces sp. NPDC048419]
MTSVLANDNLVTLLRRIITDASDNMDKLRGLSDGSAARSGDI